MSGQGAPPLFVGVDSEGAEVAGRHRLVVMAASAPLGAGVYLHEPEGISSVQALEFLGRVRDSFPKRRLVVFSGRYDVTQWLAGLPRGVLRALWTNGDARWHRAQAAEGADRYSLRLVDGHSFGVWREPWTGRVRVTDVWGLFQSSFVDACAAWGVDLPELVGEMKRERASFEPDDPRLVGYCLAECRALAELMGRVAAKGREVGFSPSSWGAPGALAANLLRRHKAGEYIAPSPSPKVREAALTAYYGGRVDMLQQGECKRVLALDMRSAYPWALSQAPSMIGEWRHIDNGIGWIIPERIADFSMWRARFESPRLRALTPLPVRTLERVTYPASGQGWWHACELKAAVRAGARLEVFEGFVFTPDPDEPAQPWAWLRDTYAQRAELRAAGDEGERLVKVALNAVYGKLAQSRGEARWQCFELAGWVTAMIRACMLDAANRAPGAVVSIHTDGLLFDATLTGGMEAIEAGWFDTGEALGEWEAHEADNLLIVQPGVYTYDEPGVGVAESRRIAGRQRGIAQRGLSWDAVEDAWRDAGTAGRVRLAQTMHHGIGTCAGRRRWGTLGQWVSEPRTVSFAATTRFPSHSWVGGLQPMMPVQWAGPAIPYEPKDEPDPDELLRREQPPE